MAYVLDAAVILIVGLCVWHGWRRGFIRSAVMLVGFAAAAFLAVRFCTPVAAWIYETAVSPYVEQAVVEYVRGFEGPQVTIGPDVLFGEGSAIGAYFATMGWETTVQLSLSDLSEEAVREAVRPVIAQVLQPIVMYLLKAVVALLGFLVLLVLVCLLSRLLDKVFTLPVLKQINTAGGITVGLLQGAFWVFVFAALLQLLVSCGLFGTAITAETLNSTYIVSILVNWIEKGLATSL